MTYKCAHILAARPNFIKASPVIKELEQHNCKNIIIHTNQHYDYKMSKIFFQELDIPEPTYHLGVKSGSHAEQTGNSMIKIESVLTKEQPDYLIVYGDVNSTLAGALAASKLNIPIFHIESGCRSFDNSMPEEINRILVDSISDLLFCTEPSAYNNLLSNNVDKTKIKLVGNTAIDTLHDVVDMLPKNDKYTDYYLCTLHRPFNVDCKKTLHNILTKLNNLNKQVIIPAHPRLKNSITNTYSNIKLIDPLGYLDFINCIKHSNGVISDSGGVQCECAFLNIPLLTLRPTTEHLITLTLGNKLIDIDQINSDNFIRTNFKKPNIWDGNTSKRIVDIINQYHLDNSNKLNII